jgi:uncharacterized spore protein YtfJ
MAENAASEILDALMRNLRDIMKTESIIGQPIVVGKTTILPVIKVFVGFGAGGGAGAPDKAGQASEGKGILASGGGGGGGLAITPVGFLVVEEDRAMMVTPGTAKWEWVVESIPDLWERLSKIRRESKARKAAEADATPPSEG